MREIKFRAWDKDNSEMYYQNETKYNEVWEIDFNGIRFLEEQTIDSYLGGEYHDQKDEWVAPNQILMQYTGLKDKNGKEIYEGDIVECTQQGQSQKGEVNFKDGMFNWEYKKDELSWLYGVTLKWDGEIIGNIYENPELLKQNDIIKNTNN
jgi:uncharacterized phage protein (TIGR01671 family)